MKKILIGLVVLVVLVVAGLAAAPFFIPVETYKDQIAQRVEDATGRQLSIDGDLRLSLLPRFELEANDVAFANAPGASTPNMATLETLLIQLQVWPLLSGEVKVDSFVLVEPVINLEVAENGTPNWRLAGAAPAAEREAPETGGGAPGGVGLQQLSLGDVRLERGRVTYRDNVTNQTVEISDIDMAISLPDLDSPMSAEGSLVWNGETLELSLETESLRGLMEGRTTPVRLALDSAPVTLGYQGQVTNAAPARIEGTVELDVPSVRELAAWTGSPIEGGGSGLGPLSIEGKVAASPARVSFSEASLALDDIKATGQLSADIGGAKPYL
ncbi:MAG TPA: AsmA family protein, partial [Kiloniellales bacterium]|nr:AsmA family protein [Kiloniellales bacterium]